MNCQNATRKLLDYHKGKLSFKEYQVINTHIATCDVCAEKLDGMINEHPAPKEKKVKHNRKYLVGLVVLMTVIATYQFMIGGFGLLRDSQASFGEAVDIRAISNNIELTVTHVAADEEETILYFEIKDLDKQVNFFTDYNRMNIDENMINPYAASQQLIYTQEEGVSKGKLHLQPILKDEETLSIHVKEVFSSINPDIKLYSTEWFDPKNQVVVHGDWRLDIPIKKHKPVTYEINETVELNGAIVTLEQLIASPTRTTLTFQYQRNNSNEQNRYIRLSHLEVDGERYEMNHFQGEERDGIFKQTVFFESIFYNQPKEVDVHFATMVQHIANQEKIEFNLEDIPFTFEYVGEKITVEKVEVGNPTTIVVKEHFHGDRAYNSLNIEPNYFRFSGDSLHEITSTTNGVWLDKDGNIREEIDLREFQLLSRFTTEQHIEIQPDAHGNFFEPKFIFIHGYTKETILDKSITVPLVRKTE